MTKGGRKMDNMLPMLYETVFGIFALFVLTKILGKTQISQLTAFDFIAAIVLGELVGNALFDPKTGILDIAYVITLWGIILYTIEMITQKFKGSRKILDGKPSFLIHKGQIVYDQMRKNKIDINELRHLLRMKDVFSIQEVEYAILETNGLLSVMKKPLYDQPTNASMNIKAEQANVSISLILDGEIVSENLKEANVTKAWLTSQIKQEAYQSIEEVFYAEWLPNKPLYILPYEHIRQKDYKKKLED